MLDQSGAGSKRHAGGSRHDDEAFLRRVQEAGGRVFRLRTDAEGNIQHRPRVGMGDNLDGFAESTDAAAIAAGAAFSFVDVDTYKAGAEDTMQWLQAVGIEDAYLVKVRTAQGGLHYWLPRFDLGESSELLAPGLDVKSWNAGRAEHEQQAFLFAPGTYRKGGRYEVLDERLGEDVADAARDVAEELKARQEAVQRRHEAVAVDNPFAPDVAREFRFALGGPEVTHGRHAFLRDYAVLLAGRGMDAEHRLALLRTMQAQRVPSWPADRGDAALGVLAKEGKNLRTAVVDELSTDGDVPLGDDGWEKVDLRAVLAGTVKRSRPKFLLRTDGKALLYPGLVNEFHGESESGKSMLAQHACAMATLAGFDCLYLDFESDPATVAERIVAMGGDVDRMDYRRPEGPITQHALDGLKAGNYAIVVIDGLTDALVLHGLDQDKGNDIAKFHRLLARPFAARGAAVVLIDHVNKSTSGRGRFAIGSQHKMSAVSGASYVVDVVNPLGRDREGLLDVRVAKDRPGSVRSFAGAPGKDRTQPVARVKVVSSGDAISLEVAVPVDLVAVHSGNAESLWLDGVLGKVVAHGMPVTGTELRGFVGGDKNDQANKIQRLIADGHLVENRRPGRGGGFLYEIKHPESPSHAPTSRAGGQDTPE